LHLLLNNNKHRH